MLSSRTRPVLRCGRRQHELASMPSLRRWQRSSNVSRTQSRFPFAARTAAILMCGILLFSCSETPDPAEEPAAEPVAAQAATATTPTPTEAPADEIVTIRTLTLGDRACYIGLLQEDGSVREEEAAFELCDRLTLIGQQVRLQREMTAVMAASCEGNPECTDEDIVNLIVRADPISR